MNEASARFNETATELNRLQRLNPFPNAANLRKMKAQAEDYAAALEKLKEELKTRVLPARRWRRTNFNRVCGRLLARGHG